MVQDSMKVRAEERDALSQMYKKYYSGLCAFVQGQVKDRAEAEDIVHDVFTQVIQAPNYVRTNLRAYLYAIARNKISKYRSSYRPELSLDVLDEELFADSSELPDEVAATKDLQRIIMTAVEELPPHRRDLIRLWLDRNSHKQISEYMGITVDASRARIYRLLKKLRSSLDELK